MKKLVLLLSALLVLSTLAPSPVFAARSSLENRLQYLLATFYGKVFVFSGMIITPDEVMPTISDGDSRERLSGDADDYGNGKDDNVIPKGNPRLLGDLLSGSNSGSRNIRADAK
jgi:hypothetical protein